jgi:predicted phosphodiesterase
MIQATYADGADVVAQLKKSGWMIPLCTDSKKPIRGLSMRSALNCDLFDFGYVRLAELAGSIERIEESCREAGLTNVFRFATFHHHLLPMTTYYERDVEALERWARSTPPARQRSPTSAPRPPDMSITANAREVLEELILGDFRLVLLGHTHEAFVRVVEDAERRRICVVGAGSLGATDNDLPSHHRKHSFNLVTLDPLRLMVRVESFSRHFEKETEFQANPPRDVSVRWERDLER